MVEIFEVKEGRIIVAFCNENLSVGILVLHPNQQLPRHNRPVKEELVQIHGKSVIKLFDNDKLIKEISIEEGKNLEISAMQYHVHSNPTDDKSITLWKFKGNIIRRSRILAGLRTRS